MTRDETILNHIKPLAIAAGFVNDPDALRLLDTSEIKIAHDGSVVMPHRYFDGVRRTKPHLFHNGARVDKHFKAKTASPEDYAAAKKSYLNSVGRR